MNESQDIKFDEDAIHAVLPRCLHYERICVPAAWKKSALERLEKEYIDIGRRFNPSSPLTYAGHELVFTPDVDEPKPISEVPFDPFDSGVVSEPGIAVYKADPQYECIWIPLEFNQADYGLSLKNPTFHGCPIKWQKELDEETGQRDLVQTEHGPMLIHN